MRTLTDMTYEMNKWRDESQWAADHAHAMAGATPLLALDMYEHSYHIDYGARAAAYVDAFMQNIAWSALGRRLAVLPVGIE